MSLPATEETHRCLTYTVRRKTMNLAPSTTDSTKACPYCGGGPLVPKTGPARLCSYRGESGYLVPEGLAVPTCGKCGSMVPGSTQLDVLGKEFDRQREDRRRIYRRVRTRSASVERQCSPGRHACRVATYRHRRRLRVERAERRLQDERLRRGRGARHCRPRGLHAGARTGRTRQREAPPVVSGAVSPRVRVPAPRRGRDACGEGG